MKTYTVEGIILKRRNIGEADRILTIFTKYHGKLQVKAKGVRKITSRRSSHIELLNISLLGLYTGTKMSIVTEATTVENFFSLKQDLTKIGFAYHLCELVDSLCPENQENEKIFDLLLVTLHKLTIVREITSLIHTFEIDLLTILGYLSSMPEQVVDTTFLVESIIERKLKVRQFLPHFRS